MKKLIIAILTALLISLPGYALPGQIGFFQNAGSVAPGLSSASINTAGTTLTLNWTASCTNGAGGSGGVTISASGGASTPTYSSGSPGTAFIYSLSRTVNVGETVTTSYTQPGNGIEATTGGADVASFSGSAVTNNSTAGGLAIITANVVANIGPTSGTTITQAVDCTGSDALFVHYSIGAAVAFSGISATYNGVAMTSVYNYDPFAGAVYEGCFRLLAPASGSHNVVITITGSTIASSVIGCTPMSGVNQTTPTGTSNSANDVTGTSGTASTTVSSATGELVLAMCDMGAVQTMTNGAGQTTVWSVDVPANGTIRLTSKAGAASVSSTFTFTAAPWLSEAVPIKP